MAKALKKLSGKTVYNRIWDLKHELAMEDNRHDAERRKITAEIEQVQERCDHVWSEAFERFRCCNCGKVKP